MAYAVTHILFPIILLSLLRDKILSKNAKAHFPLHYVFIAGLGGVLPDIDIPFSLVLNYLGDTNWWVHKTFTHSLFFPAIFFLIFLALLKVNAKASICNIGKHKLKLSIISLMIAIGSFTHIFLDVITGEFAYLFYPFSMHDYGINLFSLSPLGWASTAALVDGILLVIWLCYLEFKHKISDFI